MSAASFGHRLTVFEGPLEERLQRPDQRAADRRELVVDARWNGRKRRALHEAVLFERLQREVSMRFEMPPTARWTAL